MLNIFFSLWKLGLPIFLHKTLKRNLEYFKTIGQFKTNLKCITLLQDI